MKKILKNNAVIFALLLGFVVSITVSGQISSNFSHSEKMQHFTHFLSDQPVLPDFYDGNESRQLPYKSTQGSLPQEIHHFYWANTSVWMADYNRMDSYSTSGKILSEIFIDANTGDTTEGMFYNYDSQGRIDNILQQNWVNSNWENDKKIMYTYDVFGNDEVVLELEWTGTGWNEIYGRKFIYTYDANNHITVKILQFWDTAGDFWYNYDRYLYNYDANGYVNEYTLQWWINNNWSSIGKEIYTLNNTGVINEILHQIWSNNSWVNSTLRVNIVWHGWNGYFNYLEMESYLQKSWNSGIWEDNERMNTTYDAFGGWIQLKEFYNNNLWVNAYRETNTYDTHSNFISYIFEMWNGFAWTIDWGNKHILTYNGSDVIERIYQSYDHAMMVWFNTEKEQYSNFIYTQGITPGSGMNAGIHVYPNPSAGLFYIDLNDSGSDIQSVEVVSPNGQIVYQKQVEIKGLKIYEVDLTNYSKGLYLVKLRDSMGNKIGKIMIQ